MKFIILKKDKDSTIAKNDTVFPVNNFFVVLTLVSSLVGGSRPFPLKVSPCLGN
ncbi:TPA: hypothetical protein ACHYLF_002539 [Escherichia coli]